ncbi:SAM-dependent methyltransferase [Micromonospora sp. NPDC049559]|uniref:SAM-dependent methyltransferase n=1 Tax=Micromonospora sp. NPDC049559 TaxID=3155923 RepID=UPI00343BEF48
MAEALYGPGGFFVSGAGPAAHFRTSAHASPVFGAAVLRLLDLLDAALGRPDPLDVVDVGAGRAELLGTLARLAPPGLARRLRLTAVELAPRPDPPPPDVRWRDTLPSGVTGLLVATEWLDNVPLDVAEVGPAGWHRVLVDPATGTESTGGVLGPAEADWLARWWPAVPGGRAEIGLSRDAAWAEAVAAVDRGLALAVDYGHLTAERPPEGTLTGYLAGRQVPPLPDGSRDVTAHVAVDSAAAAGSAAAGLPYTLLRQRDALRALGVDGRRPPLALAGTDPAGYVRALATASAAAELTEPAGLGGHWWILQPVGVDPAPLMARWRA